MANAVAVFRDNARRRQELEAEKDAANARVEESRREALLGVLTGLVDVAVDSNEAEILLNPG